MKVFGVGWAKTGTTTLGECFKSFGFRHYGYQLSLLKMPEMAVLIAKRHDSFEDWPWTIFYKEMDEAFPGSKFILTTRDSARWIKSYRNATSRQQHPTREMLEARQKIYGVPFDRITDSQLVSRYERHNDEVLRYFAERPNDLLVVNWEAGDGWERLCAFLGQPVPDKPFPHANKGTYT
jgi:hypothetical protein